MHPTYREHKIKLLIGMIFTFMACLLSPIASSILPSGGEWMVQAGSSYPISIITNVETAGNGTKSMRQTGTIVVVTTSGTGADWGGCTGCSGSCLVLNRSALDPEWDSVWFAIYDHYNILDETNSEITCLCPQDNQIPAKVLTATNWANIKALLEAKSNEIKVEAEAMGAIDYVGSITGTVPSFELSYSYSNGTSSTGVKRNGKITYTNGILTKLVYNEEIKKDPTGLPPNAIVIRSEKWTMGDQRVTIPGFPVIMVVVTSLAGIAYIMCKHAPSVCCIMGAKNLTEFPRLNHDPTPFCPSSWIQEEAGFYKIRLF